MHVSCQCTYFLKIKKRSQVSKSSVESKYLAISSVCFKIVWFYGLLRKLCFSQKEPTLLYVDNKSAIQIAANLISHECTKHIEVDCHYIHEAYDEKILNLPRISMNLQIVNVFTKALPQPRHQFLDSKLMLLDQVTSI